MGGLIRVGSNETSTLGQIIPNATPRNSGVMTAAQAAQLAALEPSGGVFADAPLTGDGTAGSHLALLNATISAAGAMSSGDKSKLNGIAAGARGAVIAWDHTVPWATIYAQAQAAGGLAIIMCGDLFATYHLTTGSYNLDNIILWGTGIVGIHADAGFLITGTNLTVVNAGFYTNGFISSTVAALTLIDANLSVESGAVPFQCTALAGFNDVICIGGAIGSASTGPVFTVDGNGGFLFIVMLDSILGDANNTTPVVTGSAGAFGTFDLIMDDGSTNHQPDAQPISSVVASVFLTRQGPGERNLVTGGAVTISLDNSIGHNVVQLTSNANVTALTVALPSPASFGNGARLTLLLVQGNAAHTWPATIGNVLLPGGTFAKTATTGGKDRLDLVMINGAWTASVASALS